MNRSILVIMLLIAALLGCDRGDSQSDPRVRIDMPGTVKVAFVTNNASDFWAIARAGVRKAESDFNVFCDFRMPSGDNTAADQQRIVEDLITSGVSGIAISPVDAANQTAMLNNAADAVNLITHDSDAPSSNRLAYVGTNNYKAGLEAGKLIKEVLPNGGKIMIFVGRMDAQNAIERANGVKESLQGTNIVVLDIRTDMTDRARAKQNVEDTINSVPDIACLVGLWSYNGPAIVSAVKDAEKAGKPRIPIVCFDEEPDTLQGIRDGYIHGTVVQQPYRFGYESVRILAALARGEDAGIPPDKIVDVPVQIIKASNVDAFRSNLEKLLVGQ